MDIIEFDFAKIYMIHLLDIIEHHVRYLVRSYKFHDSWKQEGNEYNSLANPYIVQYIEQFQYSFYIEDDELIILNKSDRLEYIKNICLQDIEEILYEEIHYTRACDIVEDILNHVKNNFNIESIKEEIMRISL